MPKKSLQFKSVLSYVAVIKVVHLFIVRGVNVKRFYLLLYILALRTLSLSPSLFISHSY